MLSPPTGLSTDTLRRVLRDRWGIECTSIHYRAVGFGSHHWHLVDSDGDEWFATVDELDGKRLSSDEPAGVAFHRLHSALATATALSAAGAGFVVAPVPASDGEPVVPVHDGYALAVYEFVHGESHDFGDALTPAHRHELLQTLSSLHATELSTVPHALVDDFEIPHRDVLTLMMQPGGDSAGPYTTRTRMLLATHTTEVQRSLDAYDRSVSLVRQQPDGMVLTHGEPHPGNTMHINGGLVLIDWDTVQIAPPERDLWTLDTDDGDMLQAYTDLTGTAPRASLVELYRRRWDLSDVAVYAHRFAKPHVGDEDDAKSWTNLEMMVTRM